MTDGKNKLFINIFSNIDVLKSLGYELFKEENTNEVVSVIFKNKKNRILVIRCHSHTAINILITNTKTDDIINIKRWLVVNNKKIQFDLLFVGYPYNKNFEKRSLSLRKIMFKLFSLKELENILKGDKWWEDEYFSFIQ